MTGTVRRAGMGSITWMGTLQGTGSEYTYSTRAGLGSRPGRPFLYPFISRGRCLMRWVYLVLLLVIVTIIVVFIVQNDEKQTLTFFKQRITAPLAIYFVAVYFLGMWSGGTVVGFVKRAYQHATER